jgi:hypothetical protein
METTRLAFLAVCDAVVLLPGYPSEGDQELGIAGTQGIRAYAGVDEVLESQREYL